MIIDDEYIINYFFYYRNHERLNHKKLKDIPYNIKIYILNRFTDSESILETLSRIKHKINIKPKCQVCGKQLKFTNLVNIPFRKTCSKLCNNILTQNSLQKTIMNKYNVANISQLSFIKEKKKQTYLSHFGEINPMKNKKILQKSINTKKLKNIKLGSNNDNYKLTCKKKYGYLNSFQNENIKEKIKKTLLEKYGVDNAMKIQKVKEKYNWKEIIDKINNTKKKNKTFNTSKPESESYILLKEKYPDVQYQYKSDVYPFMCDFYIPNLDLYIECNYHWTHGGKLYEGTIEDNTKLNLWKSKNTKYYNNAINSWTVRDINKMKLAKENNLNYKVFYNISELKNWLK